MHLKPHRIMHTFAHALFGIYFSSNQTFTICDYNYINNQDKFVINNQDKFVVVIPGLRTLPIAYRPVTHIIRLSLEISIDVYFM